MSNETSSTNRPPKLSVSRGSSSSRYRYFSCVTYLDTLRFELALMAHSRQIRAYAYAYHDKDVKEDGTPKEPHLHFVIVTYTTCTESAVQRWFGRPLDDKGQEINTFVQHVTGNIYERFDYLTHNTPEARALGKYQYDKEIVKSNDFGYFKADERSNYDNITLASEMLLHGDSVHNVAKIFGRDFILHYNSIKNYVNDVMIHRKYHSNLEKELERVYDTELSILNGYYKVIDKDMEVVKNEF